MSSRSIVWTLTLTALLTLACGQDSPAVPKRPQPAERPRPEVPPRFDTPDGGSDGG